MARDTLYTGRVVVTAEVAQAKQQLQGLSNALDDIYKISAGADIGEKMNVSFKEALDTVTQLKATLSSAMNVDTGKLDILKFSQALNQSNMSLSKYAEKLTALGPQGEKAFMQLTQVVSNAEVPMRRTSALMQNFAQTMKNTVKWQISSSMLHGFMGAMKTSYGYAQDLNESLNNIRIVTGQGTEQMAKFAKEANKMAKALGTTTTKYTDASLIYYQQGLNDKEVKQRTDITTKMANVTKESVTDVSDYMTAIWNNFYDGSKSLEYYADVMTALGAATASSTDEIASGLDKFAAVADTVGLSYEYATSALATLTAETRQNADVVGNALKTLFSRIQGLSLGETEDDGTTLNKYSQALYKIGIDIKDVNGEVKTMDTLLNELGAKWGSLSKDTQIAVAQTVAGARQYTQLVALMDNWGKFQENLNVAYNSTGELQKQADIYAESWEASSKRVRSAAEGVYDSLMDDDFFIGVNKGLEGTLGVVEQLVDSLGGMPGVLAVVGAALTKNLNADMASGITRAIENIPIVTGGAEILAKNVREDANNYFNELSAITNGNIAEGIANDNFQRQIGWSNQLIQNKDSKKYTNYQQKVIQEAMNASNAIAKQRVENEAAIENDRRALTEMNQDTLFRNGETGGARASLIEQIDKDETLRKNKQKLQSTLANRNMTQEEKFNILNQLARDGKDHDDDLIFSQFDPDLAQKIRNASEMTGSRRQRKMDEIFKTLEENAEAIGKIDEQVNFDSFLENNNSPFTTDTQRAQARRYREIYLDKKRREDIRDPLDREQADSNGIVNDYLDGDFSNADPNAAMGAGLAGIAQGSANLLIGASSLTSMVQAIGNEDLSFGEKMQSALLSAGMGIPNVVDGLKSFKEGVEDVRTSLTAGFIPKLVASALGLEQLEDGFRNAEGETVSFGSALGTLFKTKLLPVIGIAAAVGAAIWGITAAVEHAQAISIEGQLERNNQALESLTNNLNRAKSEAETLNNSFTQYKKTVEALDACTKGTQAYRDALYDANDQAIQLLQNNPELLSNSSYVKYEGDSVRITDEGYEFLNKNAQQQVSTLTYGEYQLEQNKRDLEVAKLQKQYDEKFDQAPQTMFDFGPEFADQYSNATLMDSFQTIMQDTYNKMSEDSPMVDPEKFANAVSLAVKNDEFLSPWEGFLDKGELENWAKTLRDSNLKLQNSIDQNTAQTRIENENILRSNLGAQANYMDDIEISISAAMMDNAAKDIESKILGDLTGGLVGRASSATNPIVKDVWERYLEALGGKNYVLSSNPVQGNDDNRVFEYIDENNEVKTVSAREVAATTAAYEATEKDGAIQQYTEDAKVLINELNSKDPIGAKGIIDFIGGKGFTQMVQSDFENAFKLFYNADDFKQYIEGLYTDKDGVIDEEAIKTLALTAGYEDVDNFYKGLAESAQGTRQAFNSVGKNSYDEVKDALYDEVSYSPASNITTTETVKEDWLKNFSEQTQEGIASSFINAFELGGSEGLNELKTVMTEITDPKQMDSFLNVLNNFDWRQGDAQDKFVELLKAGNIELDYGSEALKKYAEISAEMGAKLPIKNLESYIATMESAAQVAYNLRVGDKVDTDAQTILKNAGFDLDEYTTEVNGERILTAPIDFDEFSNNLKESTALQSEMFQRIQTMVLTERGIDAQGYDYEYDRSDSALTVAQAAIDSENATVESKQYALKQLIGSNLSDDKIRTIFGISSDAFNAKFNTKEGLDEFLTTAIQFVNDGLAGTFSELAVNKTIMNNAALAGRTGDIFTNDAFYSDETYVDDSGKTKNIISEAGIEAMKLAASQDSSMNWALNEYNENTGKLSSADPKYAEKMAQYAEEFKDNINLVKMDDVLSGISSTLAGLKNMNENAIDFKITIDSVTEKLQEAFGEGITETFVKNNKDLLSRLGSTSMEVRKQAMKEIEKMHEQMTSAVDELKAAKLIDVEGETQNIVDLMAVLRSHIEINDDFFAKVNFSEEQLQAAYNEIQQKYGEMDPIEMAVALNADGLSGNFSLMGNGGANGFLSNFILTLLGTGNYDTQSLQAFLSGNVSDLNSKQAAQVEGINSLYTGITGSELDEQKKGGGGKADTDALTNAQLKVYDAKRKRLQAQYQGMDPERASAYIKEEIALLEKEQKVLEKQIDTWKVLLKEKVAEFEAKYPEFDIKLTDDGEIANLSELLAQVQSEADRMAKEYGWDAQRKAQYEQQVLNALQDPIDLQSKIDENVAKIANKEQEQAELELKDITNRIDWRIKQIDYQIKLLNYYQEKLLIQAHGNKQTIEAMLEGFQYQEQEMLQLFEKGATLRQGIEELAAAKAKYPNNTQIFDEQILEYQSDLIDVNMDILELRKEMEELVQNVLELALEEIDTQTERIDRYVQMLDHFNNIIDLSGRTMLDQGLKVQIGTTKVETMLSKMGVLKKQMEGLTKATNEAQEALANRKADDDETSVKFWENQVEMLKHEAEKASEEFLQSWEDALNAAVDLYTMRMEMAVNTLSDALSPYSTIDLFQSNYEQQKDIQDQYLDDATRLYELNKLNRQLNLSIRDENDLLAKSKLRDLQEEIYQYQKDGVDMSQYELDVLQKKYDLRLAEIALMEAQNSKTSMRLIRDAGGNWTYAYDADEEAIEDATQKYEDAVYELDQMAKQYIDDVSEQILNNQIEYRDALMDLDRNAADYQDQVIALQEYYTEKQRYFLDELNKAVEDSGITFHDTLYGQMADIYTYEEAYSKFLSSSDTAVSDIITNYKDLQSVVEQAMNVAGTSWENFGTDTEGTLASLETYIQQLCDEISELVDVLMAYVSQAIGMVEEWQSKYSKRVDQELATNEGVMNTQYYKQNGGGGATSGDIDYSYLMTAMVAEMGAEAINTKQYQDLMTARDEKIKNNNMQGTVVATEDINNVLKNASGVNNVTVNIQNSSAALGTDVYNNVDGSYYTPTNIAAANKGNYQTKDEVLDFISGIIDNAASGDTGMYTGDWNFATKNGKMAILHEKELVLNQEDTRNILDTVRTLRGNRLSMRIDEQVKEMLQATEHNFRSLIDQVKLPYNDIQPIEQHVEINAEFPNVTNHLEIQEALTNLSNDAYQYLNLRKNI